MSDTPRPGALVDEGELGPVEDEAIIEDAEDADAGDEAGTGDDGDAGDEDQGGEDEEVLAEEPPAPRRGGGSQAVREQRRRAQEAERRAGELEREIAELRGFQNGVAARQPPADPQAQQKAEQEFYAQLEMMPLPDAIRAATQRAQGQVGAYVSNLEFRLNDRADKASYDAEARVNPIYKKYQPEVERVLAAERAAGRNPDREVILDVLYGREMRQRATRAAPVQRRAGAARVAAARTQPTGARSTAPAAARKPAPGSIEADRALIAAAIARGEKVF